MSSAANVAQHAYRLTPIYPCQNTFVPEVRSKTAQKCFLATRRVKLLQNHNFSLLFLASSAMLLPKIIPL